MLAGLHLRRMSCFRASSRAGTIRDRDSKELGFFISDKSHNFGTALTVGTMGVYKIGILRSQSHTKNRGQPGARMSTVIIRLRTVSAIPAHDPHIGVLMARITTFPDDLAESGELCLWQDQSQTLGCVGSRCPTRPALYPLSNQMGNCTVRASAIWRMSICFQSRATFFIVIGSPMWNESRAADQRKCS